MEYRTLGHSGLKVSLLSFGTMTFDGSGQFAGIGQTRGADAERQIDLCIDAGVNLFDTADVYSAGGSEEVLGEVLGQRRDKVLVATKAFGQMGDGVNDLGTSRHHLIRACEASLRRLKTDYIDLYQVHSQDLLTPAEETLRALDDLVRQGKVRYIGSSNHSGWAKMKALATSERLGLERYVSQQIQYSLLRREAEHELLPLGVSEGVGAIVWGPLASGYLSGKHRGQDGGQVTRLSDSLKAAYDDDRGRQILDVLQDIAGARSGCSLGQVALNWIARKAGISTILIGARTEAQLLDNLAAATWSLTDEEIERLDQASATPTPYPYSHHARFGASRIPLAPLLPRSA